MCVNHHCLVKFSKNIIKFQPVRIHICVSYLIGLPPASVSQVALTTGSWEVLGQQLWVDTDYDLVYFLGLRENPLEKHLYVVSLKQPGEIRLLTQPGYSYSVDFSEVFTYFY